jgi:hypothetical protein
MGDIVCGFGWYWNGVSKRGARRMVLNVRGEIEPSPSLAALPLRCAASTALRR